ncbi:MAG TPA: DUF6064 family protein [Gemmatimonadales bacterium]|nr:DUF6064 family protein [Gemmatimonadales bacterium]
MPEWWTYTLSDFLMFSPRTYFRMLERHNEAVWPAQIVTVGIGLGALAVMRRAWPIGSRVLAGTLAGLWLWVGVSFLWQRYAAINWAAAYIAPLFVLEAVLLLWVGAVRGRLTFSLDRTGSSLAGLALWIGSVVIYPAVAPLAGRPWRQAEVFGVAPDPTAIASLGVLLLAGARPRWILIVIPMIWCVFSGLTLVAMESKLAIVPAGAAVLVLLATARGPEMRGPSSGDDAHEVREGGSAP